MRASHGHVRPLDHPRAGLRGLAAHGARSHAGSVRGEGPGRARGLFDPLDDGTLRGLRPDAVRPPRPPAPGPRHVAVAVRRGAGLPRVAQRVRVRVVVQHGREATVPSARLRRRGRADGLPRARPLRDPAPQDDRPARGVPQRLNVRSHRLPFNEVDMRAFALPIACSVLGALLVAAAPRPLEELRGFSARAARDERDWEAKLQAIPSSDSMRSYMRRLSARPHHVGSPYDKANAEWLLAQFKEWGWQAQIETFDVLFPTPRERAVELVTPTRFVAKLQEPPVAGDPTSAQQGDQLPTYNAYSIDGDVTAPLVYVNYGIPADYERLERLGVSVQGAIVIARYGGAWGGVKPQGAGGHGAGGWRLFSHPPGAGSPAGGGDPPGPPP